MKAQILAVATVVGFLALGTAVFAAENSPTAPTAIVAQTSVQDAEAACTAAKDPPRPLAIVVKGIAIVPATAPNYVFGASMAGSCAGTPQFVKTTQNFKGPDPFPSSWWTLYTYPIPQWYGTL